MYINSKSIVTQNISNLQEWYQNMQNGKTLFTKRFTHYKTFIQGGKNQTSSDQLHWTSGPFLKVVGVLQDNHLSKKTTFEWSQEWSSYTSLAAVTLGTFKLDFRTLKNTYFFSINILTKKSSLMIK